MIYFRSNIGKNDYFRSMLFSRFFKQPKPNKFGYTPLYYDEQKEKREYREKMIKSELGISSGDSKEFDTEGFRERFASQMSHSRKAKPKKMFALGAVGNGFTSKSNTRLLLLIIIAGIILYWQFKA